MPGLTMLTDATSVSLVTSSVQDTARYHLLQLTPDMIPLFEAKGEERIRGIKRGREGSELDLEDDDCEDKSSRLCIKGRHSDEAFLCTADQTFALREMTQSNSLLLCSLEELSSSCVAKVRSNVAEIWELLPVVARTGRIAQLLQDTLYQGDEEEERETGRAGSKRYTPQQVASIVQASAKELQEGIDSSHVILLNGFYRMISPTYLLEALHFVLNHIDLCAYPYEKVPLMETMSALEKKHGLRRVLIQAILLRWFGKKREDEMIEETVKIDMDGIVRFMGLQVLETRAQAAMLKLDDFMSEWEKTAGPNLSSRINVQLLKGHYLTFPAPPTQPSDTNPIMIQHFDASDLPLDPSVRLQHLFQKRPQWTLEELSPFLDEIAIDSKKRDSILLKFARSNKVKVELSETKQDRKVRLKKGILQAPTQDLQLYSARLRHG